MNIIEIDIEDLKAYENNPRNNEQAVEKVVASIEEFGFKVPIIIDRDNVIIAGHTRLLAAKELGLEKVPCIVADDLTPEQAKAFRLADNKVSEYATWDFQKLNLELEELQDFEMQDFGFYETSDGEDYSNIFDEPSQSSEADDVQDQSEDEPEEKSYKVIVLVDSKEEAEEVADLLNENGWDSEVVYE